MNFKKLRNFLSYWKEVILISVSCIILFIIIEPDHDNPFYTNHSRTGSEVMAARWPNPDFNDPNFLTDFRYYMGFDFHNPDYP